MNSLQSSAKNGLILAAFALLSAGLTAMTWLLTKDQIQSEKEKALFRAIAELVPTDRFANDPYTDCTLITHEQLLGSKDPQPTWRLRDADGKPVAAVISSIAPNGYNGKIKIIVGHYFKQSLLAGARVTEHKETPGLGDKIETQKSRWIMQFADTSTQQMKMDDWQVKKDGGQYDAFTGATITPRAVLLALGKNIDYFNQYQHQIFSAPSNCFVEQSQ
ncbi:MAG: electron transport complex subunit RsxG [Gammaproteobacteria bacterium]|nr:electron transport complex subunit RsxG [Gammaproteobacteria bacterium]